MMLYMYKTKYTMDDITDLMETCNIDNNDMCQYIQLLDIDNGIKEYLIGLVKNDNYCNYLDIYNICIENDIELPPI